ncbi:ATPase, T2SS/T4P/T4SS family [Parafrankia sp. EUN1f]|uniref:ATPase, T2SS/T4P/T4SS family n=1 Tax=Parafrankia sp. EUN1f TaxID=102897 RepID=UPI0001C45FE4|nr:ATPase, T2SS/T4P/T4SS family [Parafrankia sp. EUN1f]EFC81312.1 type II secretion system protein E [Parafrankia sp. EUN1f]
MTRPPDSETSAADESTAVAVADSLREWLLASLAASEAGGDQRQARAEELIDRGVREEQVRRTRGGQTVLDAATERAVRIRLRQDLSPLGPMTGVLTSRQWSDVEVNGAVHMICTERAGGRRHRFASPFRGDGEAFEWAAVQAAAQGRRFDEANPSVRVRLPGGTRLHAIAHVTGRVHLSCRLSSPSLTTLDALRAAGMLGPDVAAVLTATARMRDPCGLIISGATAAGKTTLLRAVLNAHPDPIVLDRIVTVEDEAELFLDENRFVNLVAFEAREPNLDGRGAYPMERFLTADLRRLTPDRVALGELKPDGGVMPLLLALGQGVARGVATTIHAPSAADVVTRIRTYAAFDPGSRRVADSVVLDTVAATVDLVVQVARIGSRRVVTSLLEVAGRSERGLLAGQLWRWNPNAGRATRTSVEASDRLGAKLAAAGLDPNILARERTSPVPAGRGQQRSPAGR